MSAEPRLVQVRQQVLKQNDIAARALRSRFEQAGVYVVSLVSSPGAGKTSLLRETLRQLVGDHGAALTGPVTQGVGPSAGKRISSGASRVAALVGDLATENDARRLSESGAPVRQIVTGTVCHLEAAMVERALEEWNLAELDYLFIENVGNLVCPASYDLGENLRVVLVSTTEGEDKPQKYPTIFNTADLAVITKADLAVATGFDRETMLRAIQSVRPGLPVLETSARTGEGMAEWIGFLESRHQAKRPEARSRIE